MKLLPFVRVAKYAEALEGSVFFTSLAQGDLERLDCSSQGCGSPVTITSGLESYGGLLPWKGRLLAALKSHQVVSLDPWCSTGCPTTQLVDVKRVLAGANESFNVRGLTWHPSWKQQIFYFHLVL